MARRGNTEQTLKPQRKRALRITREKSDINDLNISLNCANVIPAVVKASPADQKTHLDVACCLRNNMLSSLNIIRYSILKVLQAKK
jgi:hypothetical protein